MIEKIKKIIVKVLVIVVFAVLVPLMMTGQAGCPTGCETGAVCGNLRCEFPETVGSCPMDCTGGETYTCGDGHCDWPFENCVEGSPYDCPADCCK
ncbi:MAG: hypothetical protein QXJ06_05060 [Candidatus Aenigmatarchaeota archaeon]